MKKFLFVVAIALSIVACSDVTEPVYRIKRVVVLETNTVSFVFIPPAFDSVYRDNDTVWVNMKTHRIDDSDSTTMMSVITK